MNWENCDFNSEGEEETKGVSSESGLHAQKIFDKNEEKKHLRLGKIKDPSKDEHRKAYIATASRFGELLLTSNYEEITRSLMTEDCEVFLFNFREISSVKYTLRPEDLTRIYQGAKLIKREVKETNVDSDAATAFQICYCEILNEQDKAIIPQFSLEVFSFRDDNICKYRASFGSSTSFDEFNHPFILSPKEKMLAKVKQFKYAWAEKPDLERIASLLDPSTEYKVWRWEDQKSFTFYKHDFAENFTNCLEENYVIKCVVPYHIYSEGQFILSNFVFHLEGKNKFPGEKFIWLSTCIYSFDKSFNIVKINHQGELYRQDAVEIPFEVFPRDKIKQKIVDYYASKEASKQDNFFIDTSGVNFSIELCKFRPKKFQTAIDHIKGFSEYNKISKNFQEKIDNFQWDKVIDFYIDHSDDSYDVVLTIECLRSSQAIENSEHPGLEMEFFCMKKFYIENGKTAKIMLFSSDVPEVIPSPYDDHTFTTKNIQQKEDICM